MDAIKGIVNKVASRKLAVTAVAGAAAVTGTVELIWPMGGVQSEDRPSQRLLCVLLGTGVGAVGNSGQKLPPEDAAFANLTAILEPLITGTRHTTISENAKSLYDNIWFDAAYVTEYTGQNGVDDFDVTVFDNDDKAASLAVSDHLADMGDVRNGWGG